MRKLFVAVVVVGLTGCLSGVGPTLGLRTTGELSAGWGASTSLARYGAELGQSYSLHTGRAATYGAALAFRKAGPDLEPDAASYLGASIGLSGGGGTGMAPYVAAWPMVLVGSQRCTGRSDQGRAMLEIGVGVRFLAGAGELYVAPKLDYFDPGCFD